MYQGLETSCISSPILFSLPFLPPISIPCAFSYHRGLVVLVLVMVVLLVLVLVVFESVINSLVNEIIKRRKKTYRTSRCHTSWAPVCGVDDDGDDGGDGGDVTDAAGGGGVFLQLFS